MIYLLDTNMVSHILRQQPNVMAKLQSVPMADLHISAVTHAELMYGLAKKPDAVKLHRAVHELLLRVSVLPFDDQVSTHYGNFKSQAEQAGKSLAPLDMMIAAHGSAVGAVLVSNDAAFQKIAGLNVEDWTKS
ncbi:type II toxin-antitoxin system VapC family toxin [Neisseria leonii]|uniref:Type II toxin-antitoxin system VapC family toxin n=1 Tax=Neisseria leonii TaxID=2995413 RepID=A0A9X4E0C6_9NEIS|nr:MULTISPECIES: type II toxin-antitoxin system VapC family toxin [unclassified Neisseria]MDD9325276.1 type II toxin-antitoxin system VapC family toxin [Neisseria sp. 3986]MDD9327168.1 type II toxin-antitoxin system VapC family toxin [Neisseria sp. 51.81]